MGVIECRPYIPYLFKMQVSDLLVGYERKKINIYNDANRLSIWYSLLNLAAET